MKKLISNYFEPTSPRLRKISLALRGLIGALSGTSFIQGEEKISVCLLVAGFIIDTIIEVLPNKKRELKKDLKKNKS